jgi:hypothetical protein
LHTPSPRIIIIYILSHTVVFGLCVAFDLYSPELVCFMNPSCRPDSSVDDPLLAPNDYLDHPIEEVVEVPLLLPGWQVSALERVAHRRGITAAEMVRQLLRAFIAEKSPSC